MSNLTNSSAEPSYIARLALHSAPFSSAVDSHTFFNGEQIEQRLNLLFHLARSSDKVGLLMAEQGQGKTTLLTQLQHGAGDDLRVCRIDVQASLDLSTLIEQCLRAFGVDEINAKQQNEQETLLKERLLRLQNLNIRPLLLVDNVDILSSDNLATVIDWLSWQGEDEYLLHAIFTASRVMPELDNIHGRLQRVDLPSLSEKELEPYLMQRLETAGYKGELPFSAKELKQIYRHSQGCPAQVNQFSHQCLLGIKSSKTVTMPTNMAALLRWSGLVSLVIIFTLLLLFQDKINALFSQQDEQNEVIDQTFNSKEEALATVVLDGSEVISAEQAERDELTSLLAELPTVEGQAPQLVTPEPPVETEMVKQNKQANTELEAEAEAEAVAEAVVVEPIVEARSVEVIEPAVEKLLHHQQAWIKQQQGTHYTFQLMGSWKQQEVLEFIDKYALSGDVAEFQSDRNGRVWYALIYGVYSSKKEALQASNDWPEPLNSLPSWLRRFDSVQKQIKNTLPAQ